MAVPSAEVLKKFKSPARKIELGLFDWVWAAVIILGASYSLYNYNPAMDIYELVILAVTAGSLVIGGWLWKSFRPLGLWVIALSLISIYIYSIKIPPLLATGISGEEAIAVLTTWGNPQKNFFLTYFLGSQTATMWMCFLFVMATIAYFVHMMLKAASSSAERSVGNAATIMTWIAIMAGLVALMVRWRESYIMGVDYGHIPVSNLYEVFIVFAIVTALIYLFYEQRFQTKIMGGFAMLIVTVIIAFLLWYHSREAHEIKPLVSALRSWWMKIHVPMNFIGYGAFSFAAMMGVMSLLVHYGKMDNKKVAERLQPGAETFFTEKRVAAIAGILLTVSVCVIFGLYGAFRQGSTNFAIGPVFNSLMVAGVLIALGYWMLRPSMQKIMPSQKMLGEAMYKSITLGFFGFTIATILGAMWAADAWGSYWSWDPKETWALVVWLNYAAWLHIRFVIGRRDTVMAWWAVVGLLVTTFAFLGVNIVLGGLHSYGKL